jgi:hypothetical protein
MAVAGRDASPCARFRNQLLMLLDRNPVATGPEWPALACRPSQGRPRLGDVDWRPRVAFDPSEELPPLPVMVNIS